MPFNPNPSIFRECDIRGIAGRDLSPEFAELLGQAYARLVTGRVPMAGRSRLRVAVGRDCRLSSDDYAEALIRGLLKGGLDVVSLGVCPTPVTYFSLFYLDLDGGIMVTGSHNSGDYNGFKVCVGRDAIYGPQVQELRVLMQAAQATQMACATPTPAAVPATPGMLSHADIIPLYIDHLIQGARQLTHKKIVLDCGNGTASTVVAELFGRLGAEVIPLYCELDGRFPNRQPDPAVAENLRDLVAAVLKNGADFGLGFDGDSDRIGLVDERGRILYGDELMVIFSRDVLREHPGATILSEVKSSHRLYNDIAARGGKPLMWKTGHALIKAKMKETRALLAGEMSGHVFFADRYFGYDDAIYAGLRVYEIASAQAGPLSQILSDLPATICTPEIRIACEDEKKFRWVEETRRLLAAGPNATHYAIHVIDGVRVDFGDAWGLVRASNTQPALVLRFEATTQARLDQIRALIETTLDTAARSLGYESPFQKNP